MPDSSKLDDKRGWRRLHWGAQPLWVWILLFAVLGGASLPPLAHFATQTALSAGAAILGFKIQATVQGDLFSEIRLGDVRVAPRSVTHPFLRSAEIKAITLQYDLRKFSSSGISQVLTGIKVQGAKFHLHNLPNRSKTAPVASSGRRIDAALRSALQIPASFTADVDLQNVSVEFEGNFPLSSLSNLTLALHRDRPGSLKIEKVTLASGEELGAIAAPLTSEERQTTLGPLKITPDIEIRALSFGTAKTGDKKAATILLASTTGTLRLSLVDQGSTWHAIVSGKDFSISSLMRTFGMNSQRFPDCRSLEVDVTGTPWDARSWRGTASIQMAHKSLQDVEILSEINAELAAGELNILAGRVFSESTNAVFHGRLRNDAAAISASTMFAEVSLNATLEDLSEWFPDSAIRLRGQAHVEAHAALQGGILNLRPRIVGSGMDASFGNHWLRSKALCAEGDLQLPLEELLEVANRQAIPKPPRGGTAPPNAFTVTAAETKLGGPAFEISTDAASCSVALLDGNVSITNLLVTSGSNQVSGAMQFRAPGATLSSIDAIRADLQARCPLIRGEMLHIAGHVFTGSIQASLNAQFDTGRLDGNIQVLGSNMRWGSSSIPLVRLNAAGDGKRFVIDEFLTSLGNEETIQLSGRTEVAPPFSYNLEARVHLPKLDRTQLLVAQAGFTAPFSGQLEGSWHGAGALSGSIGVGECKLRGMGLRWRNLKIQSADLAASYEPGLMRIEKLQIATHDTRFSTEASWSNNTLSFSKINLQQKGREVLTGNLNMPLTWAATTGFHWVRDGRLSGVLSGSRIEFGSVLQGTDGQPPVNGSATFSLSLSGTPAAALVELTAHGKTITVRHYPRIAGCDFDLHAKHENGLLHCDVLMRGPLGTPLRMDAQACFTFDDLVAGKINWAELPLQISVRTDQAKLQLLPALLPQLRDIKGTGSVQARMQGSLVNPIFEGTLKLDCETVHFQTDRIPAITDLHASIRLDREHLHIDRMRADLGGGSLAVNGLASFLEPKNPGLSVDIKAHQVLVQRSQQLALRLDGDLRIEGRWDAAAVKGKLYAVKSMVRRDIDLLPISSMQAGGSAYKRPPGKPWFMFPREPFSDWKLDVRLATKPGDPVLIRGNRLRGSATLDLRLLGTGAAPTLEGSYISDDVIALLPFARVEVSRGRVWYSAGAPFLPQIEFTAESEIRNHRIRMYLHGPPENPQISVSSDPPLAERDALTLLTAGVLPGDFASESSQAVSSRAAALLMQEFSDKVLLKDGGSERFSALRRFSLDVGAVNSRTGNQETRLTYRLQDNVFIIGEIGANGDFATRLRYAFRFY